MPNDQALIYPSLQRLFLALWPDEDARNQLAAHAQQWTWPPGCGLYPPQDWHVTLHFIGQLDAQQVPDIIQGAVVPFQPFELVLDQPVLWPHGLAVVCASQVPKRLLSLFEQLGQAVRGLGLPVETRPYRPHLTLSRRAGGAIIPVTATPVVWQVQAYALALSTGERDTRYKILHAYE